MVLTVSYQTAVHICLEAQILYLPDIKTLTQKRYFYKFRKIHRKTPVPESFFNKVAGLRAATLLKRDFDTGAFL